MHITRLRLLGFKSFVEPSELVIERGLTGVVGPNGCGKSNLLEALRWAMGEASHKSMRAASMDDVIFNGTTARPAREAAEVTMVIDNTDRQAPVEFNDHDIIEITRRIERQEGSSYRINGREARARDVKILFEDAATGARSPALVRQGQIGEIVNAKPEQRRRILEDAAGIAGLHSRRHEADLRLRAAEANLTRLKDILGQLSTQTESLKRQARAARRYKDVSAEIKKCEALVAHLAWTGAQAHVDAEETALAAAMARIASSTQDETNAEAAEAETGAFVPGLRDEENRRAAALARLEIEKESFERDALREMDGQRELAKRAAEIAAGIARETNLRDEARETLARLASEEAALRDSESGADGREQAAREALAALETQLGGAEASLGELTRQAAEHRAKAKSLATSRAERQDALANLERRLSGVAAQIRDAAARAPDAIKLVETTQAVERLAANSGEIERAMGSAETALRAAGEAMKASREAASDARLTFQTLETERATIATLLAAPGDGRYPAIADSLRVTPGYEAALAASLGDDLDAPLAPEAPAHWREIEPAQDDPGFMADAEPLILHVEGPPEIARRLRQIGVVPRENGARLQRHLRAGQRLVSREGDLWRWDGFVAAASAESAAAQRLALRNRFAAIANRADEAKAEMDARLAAEKAAADALREAEAEERRSRQLWRDTQSKLAATREALAAIERAARETEAKLAALGEAKAGAEADIALAREALALVENAAQSATGGADIEAQLAASAREAQRLRAAVSEARNAEAALLRERQGRAARLAALPSEIARWEGRREGAERQIADLSLRREAAESDMAGAADLPARIEADRESLRAAVTQAQAERNAAAEALAAAGARHREAAQALRAAQTSLGEAREARARVETKLEGARERRQEEARRIRETLEVAPDGCLALAEAGPDDKLPAFEEADRRLAKLRADRERLGGVNLDAEEELAKLGGQTAGLDQERADVEDAIGKLRHAIGQLNREGKVRLGEAFTIVNAHFQRLFATLFNGGEARLEMIDSEDPLEGGLEIVAKPPGKKPATLSLLSGGEQTLTALALIFAVFLTNPSPICVLDEVDAPLDDSNVDRFAAMMERMAAETSTRFLVITHHPMTMARMNRLFGVTMQEKGVSRLVSVDLEEAQRYQEAV